MEASQFLLKWNNHQPTVVSVLDRLLSQQAFVDVTLACDGQSFAAHKIILSACSGYFQQLLLNTPCQHPIIFLKDVRARDLSALLQFMYRGEINVQHDDLAQFLRTAESLQIKGLADTAMKTEPDPLPDPPLSSASEVLSPSPALSNSRRNRAQHDSASTPGLNSDGAAASGGGVAADLGHDLTSGELQKRSLGAAVSRSLLASALGHLVRPALGVSGEMTEGRVLSPVSTSSVVFPMELDPPAHSGATGSLRVSPSIFPASSLTSVAQAPLATTPSILLGSPTVAATFAVKSRASTPSPAASVSTGATSPACQAENGTKRQAETPVSSEASVPSASAAAAVSSADKTGGAGPVVKAARLCPPSLVSHPSLAAAAVAAAVAASAQAAAAAAATPPPTFTPSTPLMCKYCGQMFSDASNRFRHEKRHKHPEEVHVCFVCKRPFSRKDNMKKHVKTVHGVSTDLEVASTASLGSSWSGSANGVVGNGWSAASVGSKSGSSLQAVDMTTGR